MKMKDILSQLDLTEEDCALCEVHTKAYETIPDGIVCPKRNHVDEEFRMIDKDDFTVVGETNGTGDPDENIFKYPVHNCPGCGASIALIPTEITYNANHDIHYTGGKLYLHEDIKGIREAILPKIEQYRERLLQGENLDAWYLSLWIERGIEHLVATYLYERGFKK